jgi:hypothetical protein
LAGVENEKLTNEEIIKTEKSLIYNDGVSGRLLLYEYEVFAKKRNPDTFYDETYGGWYIMTI